MTEGQKKDPTKTIIIIATHCLFVVYIDKCVLCASPIQSSILKAQVPKMEEQEHEAHEKPHKTQLNFISCSS